MTNNINYQDSFLKQHKELWRQTFLIALGVASLFFIPYIFIDSGYFLFFGDFNVQQVPFYQMCHEMIREGNIGWNWNTDLGANFIGSYSFYLLGSPFFWLTLPFPNWMIPYLMGPLLILKFGCAAVTAYFYIRRFTKTPTAAMLGGLLYAFSGFSIYNIFFNHFHEAIIFFPLLLLAIELFITKNRRGPVAIMVCVCGLSNYFFFFGMVVFVIIYWFVRVLSGCWKISFSRFLWLIFECILGVLLGAALLYPSLLAVIQNSRVSNFSYGWGAIMYGKEQIYLNILQCFFFPPDLPARPVFFPDADVKWSSLGGWLPLFGMTGVFAWMQCKRGHWLRRIIGIMIFMSLVPILNSAFYMFNTAYYARWFYMPVLMMCLATAMSCEDREVNWNRAFKWSAGITFAFTLVIGLFPSEVKDGKITKFGLFTDSTSLTYIYRFGATCAIAIIGLAALKIILTKIRKNPKAFYSLSISSVCIITIIYASVFIGTGKSHAFDTDSVMIDQLIEGEVDLPGDSDNYRIDVYSGVDNTGMYLGLPSINCFHSIVPASVTEFYKYVGEDRGVASRPSKESYAIRPLLSVKYLLNRDGGESFETDGKTAMSGYNLVDTIDGYKVYENENYIPYGFTYEYYMTNAQCESSDDKNRSKMMLKALLLSDEQVAKYGYILKNIDSDYNINNNDYTKKQLSFDEQSYSEDCYKLAATSAIAFERDNGGFTATVNLDSENLVFFSVPYEEGWSAYIGGRKVEIEKVNVGFMAVCAPAGVTNIRFEYRTPGLSYGLIVSGIAFLIFILYIAAWVSVKRRHPERFVSVYPEGDKLWAKFAQYDLEDSLTFDEHPVANTYDGFVDVDVPLPKITDNIYSGFEGGFQIDETILNSEDEALNLTDYLFDKAKKDNEEDSEK
ncbi:MAG: YfhO family protein [Oscillospiraceae bacterium]|nr:YfhO family protein [Oscillospiraceae bacterium]